VKKLGRKLLCLIIGHDWTDVGEYGEPYSHCRRGCGQDYVTYFWR